MASSWTESHSLKRKRTHSSSGTLQLGRLEDLFAHHSQSKEQQHVLLREHAEPTSCTTTSALPLHHQQEQEQQQEHIIPTFRLEHRQGGLTAAVATRGDEEQRLLLFRSDRAGAIAKIIFSIEDDNTMTTTAKIHSLFVKPEFRGRYDLGGLLVTQALQCLQSQASFSDASSIGLYLSLDAEEDTRRHNQLIQFYQQFGCRVKKTKPLYLYHNDGEMYRKVPMELELKHNVNASFTWVPPYQKFLPITISSAPFFFSTNGSRLNNELRDFEQEKESCIHTSRRKANHHWMLVETTSSSSSDNDDDSDDGRVWFELHTTRGAILMARRSNGSCQLVSFNEQEEYGSLNLEPLRFEFVPVNGGGGPTSHPTLSSNSHRRRNDDRDDDNYYCPMQSECPSSDPFDNPKRKLSWCLRSTHGLYLSLSPASSFDQQLECSLEPIVWYSYRCRRRSGTQDSNNEFESYCLECSGESAAVGSLFDTPEHQQSLEYVESMHAKYLHKNINNNNHLDHHPLASTNQLTIEEALDMAGTIPAFGKDCGGVRGPSLRTLCVSTVLYGGMNYHVVCLH